MGLQIAVIARHHAVPFYVAAPFTSIDFNIPSGEHIVIEERPECEMTCIGEQRIAAPGKYLRPQLAAHEKREACAETA